MASQGPCGLCIVSKAKKLWPFEAKSRGSVLGKGLLPDVEAGTTKTWTAAAADLGRGTLLSFMVPCCLVTLLGGGAEAKLDLKHQPGFFVIIQGIGSRAAWHRLLPALPRRTNCPSLPHCSKKSSRPSGSLPSHGSGGWGFAGG